MLHLCYTYNTTPPIPHAEVMVLRTVADIRSAAKKMKFDKWPDGGYILEIKPPRMTPLMTFGKVEFIEEVERLGTHYRRLPDRDVYLCYAMNYDAITAPVAGVKPQPYIHADPTTNIEVEFPAFSVFDTEKELIGSYVFEFFDDVGVYTPEHHYVTSDYTDPIDIHFRDLTKWVKRASDLEKIIMITSTQIKPLADRSTGKLAMVYMLIDRYNRRYVVRMPTTPVSKKDLPRIAKEFDLPDLEQQIIRSAAPHLLLPWGYWYNELGDDAMETI